MAGWLVIRPSLALRLSGVCLELIQQTPAPGLLLQGDHTPNTLVVPCQPVVGDRVEAEPELPLTVVTLYSASLTYSLFFLRVSETFCFKIGFNLKF